MVVKFMGERHVCTHAIRGADWLSIMDADTEIAHMSGVGNWDVFELEDGIFTEYVADERERIEALESAVLSLLGGVVNV